MRDFIEPRNTRRGPAIPPGGRRRLRERVRLISVQLDGCLPAVPEDHAAIDAAWIERDVARSAGRPAMALDAADAAVIIRTTIIGRGRFRTDRGA